MSLMQFIAKEDISNPEWAIFFIITIIIMASIFVLND